MLTEVNCWLGCLLECGSVMCCFNREFGNIRSQRLQVEISYRSLLKSTVFCVFVLKCGEGCLEAISWKSNLVRKLAEVNCWLLCLLKCGSVMLFAAIAIWSLSKTRSWKSELMRELTEVDC